MKKIGIVGWNTGENSFGVTKPYIEWLSKFGIVQILAPQKGIDESVDLLILPGGLDLAPQSSGMLPSFYTSNTDVMKQYFYDINLPQYLEKNIPIFGICLGFQQLCSMFGGTLIQHINVAHSLKHRSELVDVLDIQSPMYELINKESFKGEYKINSLHHQVCFDLPKHMVLAREKTFGNIEIAKFRDNVYGVQFHPKFWGSC